MSITRSGIGTSHVHLCDPHENPRRPRRRQPTTLTPKPSGSERLKHWLKKHGTPPDHIQKRPLMQRLPKRVVETNNFSTNEVFLDEAGKWHLGSLTGEVLN